MSERPTTERSSKGGAPGVPARPDAPAKTVAVYDRPEKNARRSNAGRFVGVLLVILVVAVVLFLIYWFL